MTEQQQQQQQQHLRPSLLSRVLILITVIIRIILYPLRLIATIIFPPHEFDGLALTADKSAQHFSQIFSSSPPSSLSSSSSSSQPVSPFSSTGYQSTLLSAKRDSKICLIYLHSPLHRDSHSFLSMLKSPEVSSYLANTSSLISYGNSIHTADGMNAAQSLGVCSYPFVAVVGVPPQQGGGSGNGTTTAEIILRMEGVGGMGAEEFLTRVRVSIEAQEEVLREVERRRRVREEEIRLRREQDFEFQQTLLADQRREAEREREQRETATAIQNAMALKKRRLDAARAILRPEPPAAAAGGQAAPKSSTAKLRLTLPSGKKVDRRFYSDETLESVAAFLRIYFEERREVEGEGGVIENFSLSSSFPKRVFDDLSLSIEEAGLCPMAVIMVQDLDA